ncbi:uncharacterized protein SCHCODRAFT_02582087 [Schizophyllum commune H4-8]|uniref:uncharacterized protein n=1 Tax=Schizophyllum commune (strain H4-8 / FGSC 9210) TaxID=578458 RepID=UPI00215EC24C|nr:uncharacterized protein SCHCODRAFT_02582087 [Schizophyllum commune H4-8]KAI5889840.1 hypothetical protein SCHCODRAFT_02582087 [Schizophyllum commune H4-8]
MKLSVVFVIATIALASVVGAAPFPETNGQRLARGLLPLRPRYTADSAQVERAFRARALKRGEPSARAPKCNESLTCAYRKHNEPSACAYAV